MYPHPRSNKQAHGVYKGRIAVLPNSISVKLFLEKSTHSWEPISKERERDKLAVSRADCKDLGDGEGIRIT